MVKDYLIFLKDFMTESLGTEDLTVKGKYNVWGKSLVILFFKIRKFQGKLNSTKMKRKTTLLELTLIML